MKKSLTFLCELGTAAALFAIMALTFFDVVGRKFLDHSITGSLELTELLMVVLVFFGLPLVSARGEHVEFDSLDSVLAPWVKKAQKLFVNVLCAAMLIGLGWLMLKSAGQFRDSGETTAQLGILKAPFLYVMSVLCALTGVVHLLMLWSKEESSHAGEGTAL